MFSLLKIITASLLLFMTQNTFATSIGGFNLPFMNLNMLISIALYLLAVIFILLAIILFIKYASHKNKHQLMIAILLSLFAVVFIMTPSLLIDVALP